MFNLKQSLKLLQLPPDAWVGLREVKQNTIKRKVRNGRPEFNHRQRTHGVMVEVLTDGQFASAGTCHLDPTSLQMAAWVAYSRAKGMAPRGVFQFSQEQRPTSQGQYVSTIEKPFESMAPADMVDFLVRICARLRINDKIVNAEAQLQLDEVEVRMVSTSGTDIEQKFYLSALDFSATAQDGAISQRRSANGFLARCGQKGLEILDQTTLFPEATRTAEQALELLTAAECPAEVGSLVLMPDQMYMQIHESIGHPLELDRILGDEFNYAGHSFVKTEDFGKLQYGSPLLNVVYDPTQSGEYASFAFDDVGAKAEKQYLIKEGVLQRALGGLESQARAKIPGVANSRSNYWNRAPIDRMGNLNIEPGTTPMKDLIAGVKRGILMESNRSWSIDDRREKFQFGCEYGKLIENGEIKHTVRNPNYRGTTLQFWNSLKSLGDAATWQVYGSPYCGKGEPNQLVRVGHAAPIAHFENIEIFGGAK